MGFSARASSGILDNLGCDYALISQETPIRNALHARRFDVSLAMTAVVMEGNGGYEIISFGDNEHAILGRDPNHIASVQAPLAHKGRSIMIA